jgi:hypothetical protein
MDTKILKYEEVRHQIKNGDVLLFKGKNLGSWFVQMVTRSPYSHAGIAAWWNERLMVMEARGKGVSANPFSVSVAHSHGTVEWFTCVKDIYDEDRLKMVIFAQEELGKSYGRWKTIALGLKTLFSHDLDKRDRLRKEGKLFCSEYVARVYNFIGLDLMRQRSDRFMKPHDIADSPLLERKGRLSLGSKR